MRRGPGHYSKRSSPAKGTLRREILLRMLKPSGVTARELVEIGLAKSEGVLPSISERLYADYGYDVRRFLAPNPRHNPHQRGSKRNLTVYRVVGRFKDSGGYRSFTHDPYCIR